MGKVSRRVIGYTELNLAEAALLRATHRAGARICDIAERVARAKVAESATTVR
jgi:hypothetical protein